MRFSIVIPCLNEAETITHSINALKKQNIDRRDFEIIVVADAKSTDNTVQRARAAGADKVSGASSGGTNFARQMGVDMSSGDIVAFLDADSEPPVDWLAKIENRLKTKKISGLSGPYDYGFTGVNKVLDYIFNHWVLPNISKVLYFIFRRKAGVMIGGNMASWRKNIKKIGGLPPLKFWGDDAAFAMLLSRKIGPVSFDPTVTVKSSPDRFKKVGLLRLEFKYARSYFKVYFSKDFE